MFDRLTPAARAAVSAGADEAALRGDRRVGTDHLLLGLLHDPEIAQLLGVDLDHARSQLRTLDRAALAAIGITSPDLDRTVPISRRSSGQPTSGFRGVLPLAYTLAADEGARRITPRHLLLALLTRPEPDPAASLLAGLGVDVAAVSASASPARSS
ncbi:Clp protease N-terminal domain-containing protein [Cellulomonas sp. ICMP 17802]|uniref:Clp protease N-terminal domain-containing protein n=1 Tax=Cellulomonas sp. ICMP 17802 TaxID=3239199 RepID=UPI00351B9BA5